MTIKKTERIMYYDEKLHRWMVDVMELDEESLEESEVSEEDADDTDRSRSRSYL